MEDQERLEIAIRRAQAALKGRKTLQKGIGTQMERMTHCVLKYYFEPDESCQEVRVGQYIADIYRPHDNRILEIQTRGFDRLRGKLDAFLPEHRVTVIYPVVREKILYWVDEVTGETYNGRKSPKRGHAWEILPEIYRLPDQQMHPNLSFLPVLIDVREYRLLDGWSRDGKRGSHRMERIPYCIEEGFLLEMQEDYIELLPESLSEEFTVKDFGKATGLRGHAGIAMKALERAGAVERAGKRGNAYLYCKADPISGVRRQ